MVSTGSPVRQDRQSDSTGRRIYSCLMTNEPTICYEFALDETAAQGGWHQANNYNLWVGRKSRQDPIYRLLERRGADILHLPLRPRLMHTVTAGTPYRVEHLFGAWRVSDADMIYLRVAEEDCVYHTLLTAMCRDVKEDFLVWFCPACRHELVRERFEFTSRRSCRLLAVPSRAHPRVQCRGRSSALRVLQACASAGLWFRLRRRYCRGSSFAARVVGGGEISAGRSIPGSACRAARHPSRLPRHCRPNGCNPEPRRPSPRA